MQAILLYNYYFKAVLILSSKLRCVSPRKRNYEYARPDILGKHIHNKNLAEQHANEGFDCPYKGCFAFLSGAVYSLSHAAGHIIDGLVCDGEIMLVSRISVCSFVDQYVC